MQFTPDFSNRRNLSLEDLARLDDPAVIFEYFHVDSDGAHAYVYTVGGYLDGLPVARIVGREALGATVGGDVIIIHAADRKAADEMAAAGLETTIIAVRNEPGAQFRELGITAAVRGAMRH
jgi:hypothetical protein